MALTPGTHLGPYEITAQIGAGGMGEVYRATDSHLKRSVAIKVLPASVAGDAHRLARFQREAEMLAALNHPNIGAIYGLEKTADFTALVMELVEGDDLSQRIARGAIPIDEAMPIARQIADALEAAHEQNIVHRDLKPANIKVRADGTVKVLDFGLAKAMDPEGASAISASVLMSPTLTTPAMTQAGMILGTAAYMSPEQAKGRAVDKRADIWAFGAVLYEMLTGTRAFTGDDVQDTFVAIMRDEPNWAAVPATVPPAVATVIRRCLQKDRKQRLRDIGDASLALEGAFETTAPPAPDLAPGLSRGARLAWIAAAVLAAAALAVPALRHLRETPPASPELMRFEILEPDGTTLQKFAVSPDGRKIAFYAIGADGGGGVWVRSFDSVESRRMAETGASPSITWSPDSRFVAFPGGEALKKLMKVEVSGGPPQTVCEIKEIITGGSWNHDGIVFGSFGGGTYRVPAAGGEASPLTALDASRQETGHSTPVLLPDGKHFLYLRTSGLAENTGIYLGALDTKPEQQASKRLVATSFSPAYAPSTDPNVGYVLFLRDAALQVQSFDLARLQMTGEPVHLADHVGSIFNFGYFGVSANGVLAYRTGDAIGANPLRLTWFDRQGANLGAAVVPGYYVSLRLSPDASRVAVSRLDTRNINTDIWLHEFARNTPTRFTTNRAIETDPVWSPDGSHVAYASVRPDGTGLYQKAANGAGGEELLLQPSGSRDLDDWSRDGRFLLYSQVESKTKSDLWVMPIAGDRKPTVYVNSEFNETHGQFSPDGRWIAYVSDESGRPEIYVRPFPVAEGGGGKWTVSNGGGTAPRWRRDGKELFFLATNLRAVMVAEVSYSPSLEISVPAPAFNAPAQNNVATNNRSSNSFNWDVTADGQKFLLATVATQENVGQPPINVVLNWTTLLRK